MTIIYIADLDILSVESTEITNLISNIATPPYDSVVVTGTQNCGTPFTQEYDVAYLATPVITDKFYLDFTTGSLVVNPLFFSLTDYVDGVYKLEVRFYKINNGGYVQIMNCIFVDVTYRCKVATFLNSLIEETKDESMEKIGTNVFLLHYALTTSSNCNCSCNDMCDAFIQLTDILSGIDPKILSDCGC